MEQTEVNEIKEPRGPWRVFAIVGFVSGIVGIALAYSGWINHNLVLVMQHRGFVHHRVLYINL